MRCLQSNISSKKMPTTTARVILDARQTNCLTNRRRSCCHKGVISQHFIKQNADKHVVYNYTRAKNNELVYFCYFFLNHTKARTKL